MLSKNTKNRIISKKQSKNMRLDRLKAHLFPQNNSFTFLFQGFRFSSKIKNIFFNFIKTFSEQKSKNYFSNFEVLKNLKISKTFFPKLIKHFSYQKQKTKTQKVQNLFGEEKVFCFFSTLKFATFDKKVFSFSRKLQNIKVENSKNIFCQKIKTFDTTKKVRNIYFEKAPLECLNALFKRKKTEIQRFLHISDVILFNYQF